MPKAGQDANDPNDPNSPYNRVRQTVVTQAGGSADPTVTAPPSAPSTPSPTFTTQPTPGTTPQPQPASPTFTTQPVDTTKGPGVTTTPSSPAGTITGTNPNTGFPTVTWPAGQGPIIPAQGGTVAGTPGLPTGANPTGGGGGSSATTPAPSYVNPADPTQAAVWKAFQAKGLSPRDASDFQYWVNKINGTGGLQGDNANYWLSRMAQSQGGVGDYQERPEAGAGTSGTSATGATGATTTPYADQVRQMLMDRMGELSKPLDVNDPTITEPFGAASLAAQRQLEQGKKDTAERLYASGDLNTNAAQMAGTQANERAATGLAGVKANLIANQLTQRATQLQQLYSLAVASGDSESARQVQLELASIQAELSREGFGVQLGLGAQQFNQQSTTPFLSA